MKKSQIGVIGMGVMGRNLALNIADNGYQTSVYNRSSDKTDIAMEEDRSGNMVGFYDLKQFVESLESPKKVIVMVNAGRATEAVIESVIPFLEANDIVIDAGNAYFKNSILMTEKLQKDNIRFLGVGVSGGEEGARNGPAIMVGGPKDAYLEVQEIFETIAAKADDGAPCCEYIAEDGAGHFVKTVHNGIEYADMQVLAEAIKFMKQVLNLSNQEISDLFNEYNTRDLEGYLVEITAKIMAEPDDMGEGYLVDKILDVSEQKGTGKWTNLEAVDLGVNTSILLEGLNSRITSSLKDERILAAEIYPINAASVGSINGDFTKLLEQAILSARIMIYSQGFTLYRKAAEVYGWDLNYKEIASVFRAGCIIRSRLLYDIMDEFDKDNDLPNLMLSKSFADKLNNDISGLIEIVNTSNSLGLSMPVMSAALNYFNAYRTADSEANIIQAQRDFFGAHEYQRNDGQEGYFHHEWTI
jgi:6-phosphogluconate dehydrogenase